MNDWVTKFMYDYRVSVTAKGNVTGWEESFYPIAEKK